LSDIFNLWQGEKFGEGEGEGRKTVWVASVLLATCLRTLTGASVAGNFGLGGQETVRNPGARESERLFLAGWEVTQFGQDPSASDSTSG
jgi:hypothetical protein